MAKVCFIIYQMIANNVIHILQTVWVCIYHSRFYLIYLTLVLHGIGTLMPWNMFITAKEVRTEQETQCT